MNFTLNQRCSSQGLWPEWQQWQGPAAAAVTAILGAWGNFSLWARKLELFLQWPKLTKRYEENTHLA